MRAGLGPRLGGSPSSGEDVVRSASLILERLDRVHLGGARGRYGAEDDAHNRRGGEGDKYGHTGDWQCVIGKEVDGQGNGETHQYAHYAPSQGDNDRLGQELQLDL